MIAQNHFSAWWQINRISTDGQEQGDYSRKIAKYSDSHDDTTAVHVQEAIENCATIAEFPTTLEAAALAHKLGLKISMGAPNIVLGRSHSGNVSVMDLVRQNRVDILSSDSVPLSLLQTIFIITQKTGNPLHETIKLATSNPAKAVNMLHDQGRLEVGKPSDMITVYETILDLV